MVEKQENVFFYITAMNENYQQPALPEGVEEGILKGMYSLKTSSSKGPKVQLLGSGTILREAIAAAELLEQDFGVSADLWSVTSFNELARDGHDVERYNMLNPKKKARVSYVEQCLSDSQGPVIVATDYIRAYADQIRGYVPSDYKVLGTDGFGRSDSREKLRTFFEVNRYYIAVAALKSLADRKEIAASRVAEAIEKYGIDINKPNPITV